MSEIQNRYTGEVVCSGECSIRELAEKNKADLYEADLIVSNLRRADLRGADLREADLFRSDLRGANLYGADLRGADLNRADLSGADLCRADLRGADLNGADLNGANLRGAKYGEEELLKYFSISQIGSREDSLQVFITKENVHLQTGCWAGTPEELLERTDREDYRLAVQCIVNMAETVRKEVQGE